MAQHLIHIGYPKAGSKFLQAWFEQHPELCYKSGGLGGFRSVYEVARPAEKAHRCYVTSCEDLSAPNENVGSVPLDAGMGWAKDPTRLKKDQADVCAQLKSLCPGGRILIVTRGYKEMIMSGYSQYVRLGGLMHTSNKLPEGVRADAYGYLSDYYDFDYLIGLYAAAFSEANLIVMPYELLRDDQNRFLAVLEEKLGLEHVEIKLGRVNPSLSPEELYWYPVISRAVSAVASRLGPAGFRRVYGWYVGKTLGNRLRLPIRALALLRPGGKITEDDFPADVLSYFKGKASRLKDNSLYAPYAAEYLWDEQA